MTPRPLSTRRCAIAALLLALMGAVPGTGALAAAATPAEELAAGLACYERGEWAAALASLERAAEAGDRRAQEMAGFMRWLGPSHYGAALPRDRAAALRWFERAATGGSEVGRAMAAHLRAVAASAVDGVRSTPGRPASTAPDGVGAITAAPASTPVD